MQCLLALTAATPCPLCPCCFPPTPAPLVAASAAIPLRQLLRERRLSGSWRLKEATAGVAEADRLELGRATVQLAWFPLQQQEQQQQAEDGEEGAALAAVAAAAAAAVQQQQAELATPVKAGAAAGGGGGGRRRKART